MSVSTIRVLNVGCGHMGRSHALAYHRLPEFELAGLVSRGEASRRRVNEELGGGIPEFSDFHTALAESKPDAVCISTYPDTHYAYVKASLEAGCHVFAEKPLSETVAEAEELVALARERGLALTVGYILHVHPSWQRFTELTQRLGKPLVMRMNLNQQSFGDNWQTHKALMSSISPIVDCGVHYVDIMCQMTGAKPVRVSGIGARLTDELPEGKINYGHLQVTFDDGSVGWYEAGWGPMMSEVAFFVKDVVGPKGCVNIVARSAGAEGSSADVDAHSKTESLRLHHSELDENGQFVRQDEWFDVSDEPDHDELCRREQVKFLKTIRGEFDGDPDLDRALHSMRIVAAADESFRTGRTVDLV